MTYELELRGITKRFPGVVANDAVDLAVRPGEIHALVGENGAGKTTLMSILYGLLPPDEGEILIRGEQVGFRSALDAIEAGLGMVHQHFRLFPTLTVAENVVFRSEPRRRGLVDRAAAVKAVTDLADQYGLAVPATARIEDLSVGILQRVEILKALYREVRVLILDEPTAVLTPQERDGLFGVMRRLKDAGHTILFVTHKLTEVMAVSDRVTVLRRGKAVASLETSATHPEEISRLMTGRDVDLGHRAPVREPGEPVLSVTALRVEGEGVDVVKGVDLEVRAGEIVGVAGVAGNGQNELVEAICGLRAADGGRVTLLGRDVTAAGVAARRRAGIAYVPEDRHRVGTAAGGEVWANLLMGHQRRPHLRRGSWLRLDAVRDHADQIISGYDIRVRSSDLPVSALSGGNLQKVVLGRELAHQADVLIAEQPTRGLDVGAIEFVHSQLLAYRDAGGAVMLISAELWELLALATRIVVMFEGRVVAEVDPAMADEADIGLYMTGASAAGTG